MIFGKIGKPTKLKKVIYLFASMFLGVLLSFLAHAWIEMWYLRQFAEQGSAPVFYGGCALPPWLQGALWLAGVIGGFFLGRFWWRKIYVEKVWLKKYLK